MINIDKAITIDNAGLLLLAPYLPALFDRLGYAEESKFCSDDSIGRAVHCQQYLVNPEVDSTDYELGLNKLLCGIALEMPIRSAVSLSDVEIETLDGLLSVVVGHWAALGNTSIDGLRESFLQRSGKLWLENDAWHVEVESESFDMLLDQLPWSFTTIKFPWMKRVIYVNWR